MIFLLSQITVFLVLSALLGALAMYYWTHRNFEDVTEHYSFLEQSNADQSRQLKVFSSLKEQVDGGPNRLPEANFGPITQRIAAIEGQIGGLRFPAQFAALDAKLNELNCPDVDFEPISFHLRNIEAGVIELSQKIGVELKSLEGGESAENYGLSGIRKELASIRERMEPSPALDPAVQAELTTTLSEIRSQLSGAEGVKETQLQSLEATLARFEQSTTQNALADGLTTVEASVARLEKRIISQSCPDVNLAPLIERLDVIHSQLGGKISLPSPPRASSSEESKPAKSTPSRPASPADKPEEEATIGSSEGDFEAARRKDGSRNLLNKAAFGKADRLKRMAGVGPVLERALNEVGVYYFWQIAEWNEDDITFVDEQLTSFKGRIKRDDLVAQAQKMMEEAGAATPPER